MRKFWVRTTLYTFFALVLFFLGVEFSHLPLDEELVQIHSTVDEDSGFSNIAVGMDEGMQVNDIERIRENQIEAKGAFSQAGVWFSESVSDGFVRILEKIFS